MARRLRTALGTVIGPLRTVGIRTKWEVPTNGGVADLVVYRREGLQVRYVMTLELKLRNWRRALDQAFRNRNYANESYVLLDATAVGPALAACDEFESANVGLISLSSDGTLTAHVLPTPDVPFSTAGSEALARRLLAPRRSLPERGLTFVRSTRGGAPLSGLRAAVTL